MDESSEHIRSVFREIYQQDHWKGGSGEGSQADVTGSYREILADVLTAADVHSVVDAGCGDWQFSKLVDWSSVRYLGLDVVPELVEANREQFGSDRVQFDCVDVRRVRLPRADLLICKDILQHWPVDSITEFFVRNKHYRYMLITNDIASTHISEDALNSEISLGAWRTLDLEVSPFRIHPSWQEDFDIRGEWTKRTLLVVKSWYEPLARLSRRSALTQCRGRHSS